MEVKRGRLIKVGLLIIFAICLIVATGSFILNALINRTIRKQLTNLGPAVQVRYSTITSSIFSSSVIFDSLQINFTPYAGRPAERLQFGFTQASLYGIHFFRFLLHKKLVIKDFVLDRGRIQLDQSLLNNDDSLEMAVKEMKLPFKNLAVHSIKLNQCAIILDHGGRNEAIGNGDIALEGVAVDKAGARPVISGINLRLSHVDYPFSDYRLSTTSLELSSARKILIVDSLKIAANSIGNQVNIRSIRMKGLNVMKLLNEGTLVAARILVQDGTIAIHNDRLKPQAPVFLKRVQADVLQIDNSSISYTNNGSRCQLKADIALDRFNIAKPFNESDFHFSALRANLSGINYSGPNYRHAEIKKVEIDSKKQTVLVEELKIIPTIGKYDLGRRLGHQVDWVAARVSQIEIRKADVIGLFHQKLVAEKILIGKSMVYVFRDRRLKRPQRLLPLPVEYLASLPFDIRVQSFALDNSTVEYEEYPRSGFGQTGILRIRNATASLSPLINHPLSSDPGYMTMRSKGSIMGSGTVYATIFMPLAKSKPYHMKGAIQRLELTRLNSSSENLGKIRIKSGFLDFLSFDFTMTAQRSTGKIVGAYHHLIIQPLKKHTDEKNVANFASFMLRHVVIPLNKDISLPEQKRTGMVDYARDPTRFVSYYFLQSLLMGVKKSFTLGFLLPK